MTRVLLADGLIGLPGLADLFWGKVIPEPNSGCFLWLAAVDADGYGKFQITNPGQGPKQFHVRAHRFALALSLGRWPAGLVLHSCDTPSCVNSAHLREGTQAENIADMDRRHRRPRGYGRPGGRGELHPKNVLTMAIVVEIKRRLARGERQADVVRALGLKKHHVQNIAKGSSWRHVEVAL